MLKDFIKVVLIVLALSGCGTPIKTAPIIEQESLLQPCTRDTPVPTGTDGKALYEALVAFQDVYNECAVKHDYLINTIRELNNAKKI